MGVSTMQNMIDVTENSVRSVLMRAIYNLESLLRDGNITTAEEGADILKRLKRISRMYNEMSTPP
jgi:hypothetical protein